MESNNEVSPDISCDLGAGTADEAMNEDISLGGDALNAKAQDPGTGNLDEEVAETSEPTALPVVDKPELVADGKDDESSNNQDLGIDDEMKAMFGDDSTPEVSAQENVLESENAGGDSVSTPMDQSIDEPPPQSIKHDQILDDSNLEDMMEALHADKVEPLHTVHKQAETSGLELKDVLQALTGDLEESSNETGDKQKNKDNGDTKPNKRRTEVEMLRESTIESDGSAERILRDRSKQNIKSGEGKKAASDRKSQSVKKGKGRKPSESEEEEYSSDGEEKSQSITRGKSDKKKMQDEADDSSDSGDSKSKKPVTRKIHQKSDDTKDQKGSQNSKTQRRKPGPKSARLKSTEVDSDSNGGNSSDSEDDKQKKPTTTKTRQKLDDSKDQKGLQNSKTPRRKPGPKSARSKSTEGNSDRDEENSSDSEDNKQQKPTTTKARQKLDDSKDQKGLQNSKTPRRKPGPKSARSKSTEGNSDSDEESSADSEGNKQKKSTTTKARQKSNDSKDQKGAQNSRTPRRKPGPKSARSKSAEGDSDSNEENSSDSEDSKPKKSTAKVHKTSDDSKEQEKESSNVKPPYRKPGPKSARSKSTECDSESDDEKSPDQKSAKSRKGRKPLPGTDLVSKSNKVCIITDCRQQCFPQLGISLHRFPVGPSSIRKFWLKLVNLEPPGPTTAYICSKHFTENDYNYDAKKDPSDTFYRKLKPGAIPSVGIPVKDKMLQKVKAEVEIWKKTEMIAAMEASIENDFDRKKKPGRPHEKNGGAEVKFESLPCGDSQEEEEEEGEGDSKDQTVQPGAAGTAKALPAAAKQTKDQGEETKKVVAKEGPEKVKRTASRSPSPSSTTLQPSLSTKTPAPMIRKRPETETRGRTPGTNCSVPCCCNNLFETRAEGLNISYYRFPFDLDLADKWIKKIGDLGLNARTARICSDHFADKDFDGTGGGRKNLKPKAVPSLYLTEKKPREKDSNEEAEAEDRTVSRKRSKSKGGGLKKNKPDTSFISMPLPIIEDIKSEPPTDDETIGQDYAPSDPGSEPEEPVPTKKIKIEKVGNKELFEGHEVDDSKTKEADIKRPRGRPRKDSSSSGSPNVKTVSLASLALPIVSLERLGKRVIDAADSGSLRVRIKESDKTTKPAPKPKPGPKSKRKRVDSDTESSPANRVVTRPGPLSKKNMLAKLDKTPAGPKRFGPKKKVLKMSDNESDSDIDNPPSPLSAAENISEAPCILNATTNPVKVKPAELPKFLQEKQVTEENLVEDGLVGDDMMLDEPLAEDLDSILDSDKSDKEKIIQLVEQRISEHTKIIEGKTMGAQQLADHNKILQGSALVLKKLAEKSGKPAVIPTSIPDGSSTTPGRTIVLKKVSDPSRLGLKPPSGKVATSKDSSPSSPSKSPLPPLSPVNSARSTPSRLSKIAQGDDSNDGKACSPMEKIREYDNLMKKYLSAVLDKNLMSKKYTECKEAQKALEIKLNERNKELEMARRKISTLQAKISRTNNALEYFLTPNQIKLALQETKKVAWSPEEMLTAFTIKHLSKACYLFLRHKLNYPLPGISSLQRWMTMLSKDKAEDDEDNIADEDVSDKEESQEILEEGPGVVNEITGTLEEINACGAPGEENYHPEEGGGEHVKDSNQSSPFQVVFENDGNSNSNRKVIILKKMPKGGNGKMKMKSKLQISASENDVNVSNIEESDEKNELYKLLPGAKTISMASSPLGSQKRNRFVVPKKIKEQEKISFQRLPQVRKDMSVPKPPRIQIVKNEPQEEYVNQQYDESLDPISEGHAMQVAASDLVETVVKPEMVMHTSEEQQQDESPQKFFTISDLNSTQMEEHIVENVEHMTEDGQIVHKVEGGEVMHETLIGGEGVRNITIVKEDGVVEHHSGQAIEGMMAMAGDQQITFATTEDIGRAHHFAQIAYAQGNHGEITLHEDINNMTAVVINDIDEEQLNTLLLSNVVEQKGVEIQGEQAYGHKKIIYQTIDHDKNVIVLQPDSQAFIEEDEGTSGGAPRVYIINDEGHIVSTPGSDTTALAQEIGFIDSSAFAEIQSLGYKLSGDPDQSYTIGNLIENYAIASPTKASKKS